MKRERKAMRSIHTPKPNAQINITVDCRDRIDARITDDHSETNVFLSVPQATVLHRKLGSVLKQQREGK